MRHGETEWNAEKRYQGQMNPPLTEQGREKTLKQARHLESLRFSRVYCSPLGRTRETLELLSPQTEEIRFDDRLKECCLGVLEGRTHREVPEHHQKQQSNFWDNPAAFDLEGAESFADLEVRVRNLLEELKPLEGPVLCVTHTVIIKMLIKVLEGRDLDRLWDEPYLHPGTILRFSTGDDDIRLEEVLHPDYTEEPVRSYTA